MVINAKVIKTKKKTNKKIKNIKKKAPNQEKIFTQIFCQTHHLY